MWWMDIIMAECTYFPVLTRLGLQRDSCTTSWTAEVCGPAAIGAFCVVGGQNDG